ncbi:putative TAM domain methyltransferase [Ilyonectria robusta]
MAEPEVPHIEVDNGGESDAESGIDSRLSTYTASLTSSVVDYPYEHGRRYHAFRGGSYILPNDETEMDRLDLNHALMTKVIGDRLYLAPLVENDLHRVLDIGTGTGIWAIEMGDAHPNAQYYADDGSLKEEHSTLTWINTLLDAARTLKREPCPGPKQEEWVKAAGFKNVKHQMFKIPIGPWAKDKRMKDLGMCNLAQTLEGLEGFSLRLFCGILKWPEEEVLLLLSKVRSELKGNDFHAIFNL